MPTSYRVLDMRPAAGTGELQDRTEVIIDSAKSPEAAARDALGLELVRSGSRKDLVAQVYWQVTPEATNMVRLYSRVANPRRR